MCECVGLVILISATHQSVLLIARSVRHLNPESETPKPHESVDKVLISTRSTITTVYHNKSPSDPYEVVTVCLCNPIHYIATSGMERPSTPPPRSGATTRRSPLTPEVTRRIVSLSLPFRPTQADHAPRKRIGSRRKRSAISMKPPNAPKASPPPASKPRPAASQPTATSIPRGASATHPPSPRRRCRRRRETRAP